MNLFKIGYLLIIIGIVSLVVLSIYGIAHFALFIIFPVIYGSGISVIPFALIFLGIIVIFIAPLYSIYRPADTERMDTDNYGPENAGSEENDKRRKSSFGGLLMIGPIPIVFGNDKKIVYISIIIAILILLVFLLRYL